MQTCNEEQHKEKWNVYSLKEHFDTVMASRDEKFAEKIQALREIVDKVERLNDLKHETMNEVREQLRDQADTFLTQESFKLQHKIIEYKIERIQKYVNIGIGVWIVLQILLGILVLKIG